MRVPLSRDIQSVLADAITNGLPVDLVLAAKRKEVASAEFDAEFHSDLAARWSDAVAVEGRESPDQDVAALQKVTPEDVRRVAKELPGASGMQSSLC